MHGFGHGVGRLRTGGLGKVLAAVALCAALVMGMPSAAENSIDLQQSCFDTGFCIANSVFLDYFQRRSGTRIFGPPVSREFTLEGFTVQIFQRQVLQLQGADVARLNLLDPSILPITRANQSGFPPSEAGLSSIAPHPEDSDYAVRVVDFVRSNSPDTWNGLPVGFWTLFNSTVTSAGDESDPTLRTLLNLEIWGLPTSAPAFDPGNNDFVYQRFQRGIMHFRVSCACADGILIGDYFKAVLTGQNLPPDLADDMRGSRYYLQYSPGSPNSVARPDELPNTNMQDAFESGPPPSLSPTPSPVIALPPSPTPTASSTVRSTDTPEPTVTATPTRTRVPTDTPRPAATSTDTPLPTLTNTPGVAPAATDTPVIVPPVPTFTPVLPPPIQPTPTATKPPITLVIPPQPTPTKPPTPVIAPSPGPAPVG